MERAGVSIDGDADEEVAIAAPESSSERRAEEDQLGVFRDFINTLDLDDLEK
jgi:hypothetical protein